MKELIAEGRITPPTSTHRPAPSLPIYTGGSATEIILAEREEER